MRRFALFAAAALLALAGCGVKAASDSQPTSTPTPTAQVIADPAAFVNEAMQKALDNTVHVDVQVTVSGVVTSISGDADPAKKTLTLSMSAAGTTLEIVAIDNVLYIKTPNPTGKPWLKVDLSKLPAESNMRGALDFRSQAGLLGGATSLKSEGGGRYSGVADLDKAIAAAQPAQKKSLEQMRTLASGDSQIDFEITIDDAGRLTRLSATIDTTAGEVKTEQTLGDFGKAVSVTAPPASDVADAPAALYATL
jgi:hypothetical protein